MEPKLNNNINPSEFTKKTGVLRFAILLRLIKQCFQNSRHLIKDGHVHWNTAKGLCKRGSFDAAFFFFELRQLTFWRENVREV